MGYRKYSLSFHFYSFTLQAGQESFRSVTRIFYRGAHCVFLTYDITRDETFANLVDWLKEIQQHAAEEVKIYLIGNKKEMEEQREVKFERALEFAKSHGIHKVYETSAKTGDAVEDVFSIAGKELFELQEKEAENEAKDGEKKEEKTQIKGTKLNRNGGQTKKKGGGGCC